MRALGYLRVSTDKQAESGLGLDAQRASITTCAERLRMPLADFFVDAGTSGSLAIEDRPVLLDAVGALKRGDVLIVAKRDRLGRDVVAVAMIERLIARKGARVVSAAGEGTENDDPTGILMRRLLDSFAEYERLIIGARTKAALAAKKRRGERFSRFAPYGYCLSEDQRSYEPVEAEQSILARMREGRAAGISLARIAEQLNLDGLPTRSGTPWRFEYVRDILKRAA